MFPAEILGGSSNQNSVGFNNATEVLKTCCEELLKLANRSTTDGATPITQTESIKQHHFDEILF